MSSLPPDSIAERARKVEELITKFSAYVENTCSSNLKPHLDIGTTYTEEPGKGAVVLLTGSTGYLGSYTLSSLLGASRVSKVYALNRKGSRALKERQEASFLDKGLSASLLQDKRVTLLEADLSMPHFGLPGPIFEEMKQKVNVVIHLAWPIVHTWPLERFEGAILGTCNLICFTTLAHNAPNMRFLFGSSSATVLGWDSFSPVPEVVLHDTSFALAHSGYSEAKYVTERVLERASINSTTLRIGQLCGSRQNGAWNTQEWIPFIIKSGTTLKQMPLILGTVSWFPVDVASQVVCEIALSEKHEVYPPVFNLVSPTPVMAQEVIEMVQTALLEQGITGLMVMKFIPVNSWLREAAQYVQAHGPTSVARVPVVKISHAVRNLLAYEKASYARKDIPITDMKEYGRGGPFLTENGKVWSQTFREITELEREDVRGWIAYWDKKGLFNNVVGSKAKL
ncbi:hypothetical protein CVT24_000228 [Panaeolus cyanescens]|uniref:Thioester reductase (TE) domain-containing protein n=1 Tax=Panaeolus cyanescens TaxID=181874 RepID=A0A409VIQ6_9AGAR|nr:hypothetical protein CVT24_000228 [Panaeolus cyanescens]